jgi:hypothetical protein
VAEHLVVFDCVVFLQSLINCLNHGGLWDRTLENHYSKLLNLMTL